VAGRVVVRQWDSGVGRSRTLNDDLTSTTTIDRSSNLYLHPPRTPQLVGRNTQHVLCTAVCTARFVATAPLVVVVSLRVRLSGCMQFPKCKRN